jgi:hypothetical protein
MTCVAYSGGRCRNGTISVSRNFPEGLDDGVSALSRRRSVLMMHASPLGSTRCELPQLQQRSSQGRRPSLTMPVCPQRQVTLISIGGSKRQTASARQAGQLAARSSEAYLLERPGPSEFYGSPERRRPTRSGPGGLGCCAGGVSPPCQNSRPSAPVRAEPF